MSNDDAAAQSHPAATVQEVGREAHRIVSQIAISEFPGKSYNERLANAETVLAALSPSKAVEPAPEQGEAEKPSWVDILALVKAAEDAADWIENVRRSALDEGALDVLDMEPGVSPGKRGLKQQRALRRAVTRIAKLAHPSPAPQQPQSEAVKPVQDRRIVDTVTEFCRGADFSCDTKAATKAIMPLLDALAHPPAQPQSEKIHDGSTLLPRGLKATDMVQVASDDGVWSEAVPAGSLEWSCNHEIPIRRWRHASPTHPPETREDALREADIRDASYLLDRYAAFVRTVKADELEMHPYLPEIERVAEALTPKGQAE